MIDPEKQEILDFIKRRWASSDAHWQDGNCLWFAYILTKRFPQLEIYLLPIVGHFVAGDGDIFFDSLGEVTLTEKPYNFKEIKKEDPDYYGRLINDCLL